jgi:putative transcriptional regulator
MTRRTFDKIAAGAHDAIAIAREEADPASYRVHVPAEVDVKAIRSKQGLTQEAFAMRYGFKVGRIRDWEQGGSRPDGPARILLKVIDRRPEAIEQALAEQS